MDDFGSGYSSFNTLKDIPVDILKVDMKFMDGFEKGGRVGTILASILRMTKWLDIPVVAEGVETVEQCDFLRSIGCDYTQGFYFARPMPYDKFEEHLASKPTILPEEDTGFEAQDISDVMGGGHLFDRVMDEVLDAYAIYEFSQDKLEAIRASNGYFNLFGYDTKSFKEESSHILEHVAQEDKASLVEACTQSLETNEPRNLLISCRVHKRGMVRIHATVTCVGKAGTSAALLFVAFHVVDSGEVEGVAASCPFAPENSGRRIF